MYCKISSNEIGKERLDGRVYFSNGEVGNEVLLVIENILYTTRTTSEKMFTDNLGDFSINLNKDAINYRIRAYRKNEEKQALEEYVLISIKSIIVNKDVLENKIEIILDNDK
ncbi:MAG: hypothetical protein ACRC2K_12620 [Clostridium sp.]